jgi:hypothetical protein
MSLYQLGGSRNSSRFEFSKCLHFLARSHVFSRTRPSHFIAIMMANTLCFCDSILWKVVVKSSRGMDSVMFYSITTQGKEDHQPSADNKRKYCLIDCNHRVIITGGKHCWMPRKEHCIDLRK